MAAAMRIKKEKAPWISPKRLCFTKSSILGIEKKSILFFNIDKICCEQEKALLITLLFPAILFRYSRKAG